MVASGLGASAVPALCEKQMIELGAVCVPLINPVIERRVGIIRLTTRNFPRRRRRCQYASRRDVS
jgi:hypothetical protein